MINLEDLSVQLLELLLRLYPEQLLDRFQITEEEFQQKKAQLEEEQGAVLGVKYGPLAVLDLVAAKRGAIKKGGQPDYARASRIVIDDFRSGRIGRISLERP